MKSIDYRTVDQLHHITDADQVEACNDLLRASVDSDDISATIEDEDGNVWRVCWENVVGSEEEFGDYIGGQEWVRSTSNRDEYAIVRNVGYVFRGEDWDPGFDPMTFESDGAEWTVDDAPEDAFPQLFRVPGTSVFATEIDLISEG